MILRMAHFEWYLPDLVIMFLITAYLHKRWKKEDKKISASDDLLLFSIFLIVLFTLSPVVVSLLRINDTGLEKIYNLIPFRDWMEGYGSYIYESLDNILLFVPYGFALSYTKKLSVKQTISAGLFLSICIELIQPVVNAARICDITDMIDNTIGTSAGVFLYFIICKFREQ